MPPPRPSDSPKVMLDTGPLLTYLALQHLEQTKADKAHREAVFRDLRGGSGCGFTETEQELFGLAVDRWERLLTTSYVIAEIWRLRNHSELRRYEQPLHEMTLQELTGGRVEEVPCSVQELCAEEGFRELICRLGPTDASLIHLAAKERCLLLTDDRRMFQGYFAGAKFDMKLLDEYIESLK